MRLLIHETTLEDSYARAKSAVKFGGELEAESGRLLGPVFVHVRIMIVAIALAMATVVAASMCANVKMSLSTRVRHYDCIGKWDTSANHLPTNMWNSPASCADDWIELGQKRSTTYLIHPVYLWGKFAGWLIVVNVAARQVT